MRLYRLWFGLWWSFLKLFWHEHFCGVYYAYSWFLFLAANEKINIFCGSSRIWFFYGLACSLVIFFRHFSFLLFWNVFSVNRFPYFSFFFLQSPNVLTYFRSKQPHLKLISRNPTMCMHQYGIYFFLVQLLLSKSTA